MIAVMKKFFFLIVLTALLTVTGFAQVSDDAKEESKTQETSGTQTGQKTQDTAKDERQKKIDGIMDIFSNSEKTFGQKLWGLAYKTLLEPFLEGLVTGVTNSVRINPMFASKSNALQSQNQPYCVAPGNPSSTSASQIDQKIFDQKNLGGYSGERW